MADEMMGYKFQPGQANMLKKGMNRNAGGGGNMANQALQVLSMRLPNVLGGKPLAPQSLMTPPTGGTGPTGNPGSAPLAVTGSQAGQPPSSLATMINGAVSGSSPSGSPMGGGAQQAPSFTPGLGNSSGYAGGIQDAPASAWGSSGPTYGGITGGMGPSSASPPYDPNNFGAGADTSGGFGGSEDFMNPNSLMLGLLALLGGRG